MLRWAVILLTVLALVSCGVKDNTAGGSSELELVPVASVGEGGIATLKPDETPIPWVNKDRAADPAGDGKATCEQRTLAVAGPMSGPDAAWGRSIRSAVRFAIHRHNESNPRCQIAQKNFDTEADPQKATQVVPSIVNDDSIIGMVGPLFSGENKATGQVLNEAGLVSLNSSATNASLSKNGWRTFFRGLGNDDVQGAAVGKYLTDSLKYNSVCVVTDNTDYGVGLASTVREKLGRANDERCASSVKRGDKDFSAVVSKVKSAEPDAVFYAGYFSESALLARQLKDAGSTARFVAGDASNNTQFVVQAGDAAKGAILSCPCEPLPEWFEEDYEKLNKLAPGLASIEAYDLTTILLKGIDSGKKTRAELLDFVSNYKGDGVSRTYDWDTNGELVANRVWMYEVQ